MILILFAVLTLITNVFGATSNITATGGGIIKPGTDLVLHYEAGHAWDRCFWYWYEHHQDYQYCSYDMTDPKKGTVKLHKCKPTDLATTMEYTGKTPTECTVTIHNVTEADNCTWAVRMEDDLMPITIDITVAASIQSVITTVPQRLEANSPGLVECTIKGGRPAPQVFFQMGPTNSTPEIVNNTQTQTPDEHGIYETRQEVFIKPKISDHGKNIVCRAAILDGDAKLVYDWVTATGLTLNVTFPPQSLPNQTLTGYVAKNISISFEFEANPMPTEINWIVVSTKKPAAKSESGLNSTVLTLPPGHVDDKYNVALLKSSGNVTFVAELTILKLNEDDAHNEYHLEVSNAIGAKDYFFTLKIEGKEPNTTTTTEGPTTTTLKPTPESGNHGAIFAVVALIIITVIVLFSVLIYKRMHRNNETAPLQRHQ